MSRISKKVRDEAALICSIAACMPPLIGGVRLAYYDQIAREIGASYDAQALAFDVWQQVCGGGPWTQEVDAEAECLLRTGWSP